MTDRSAYFQNALLLGVWWSVWTLFDTYLIPFTPWSEIAMLGACATAAATPAIVACWQRRVAQGRVKIDQALERM
jgi:hypothetical protein